MDSDQTIFNNAPGEGSQTQQPPGQPAVSGDQPLPEGADSSSQYLPPHSHSPLALILKIVFAIVGLVIVLFLIFSVILPMFASKNKNVTLTYWGLFEDPNVMQSIIADFHKQNPTISVDYKLYKVNGYKDRLLFRISQGDGPDIFRYHNTWVPQLTNYLLPLPKDTITPEEFRKQYYSVASQDLVKQGAIYGIPLEIDTLALFTNNELFKAAGTKIPSDWGEFQDTAISLTTKDQNGKIQTAGAAMGSTNNITHAHDIISLLFIQSGVNIKELQSTLKQAVNALAYYTGFLDPGGDGSKKVWDDKLDPSILAFSKGNLAMYLGYSWDIFAIKATNPTLNFTISKVPHLPGTNLTLASYWVEGVSAKSKNQKEALLFMKYLTKKDTQQKLYAETRKTRLFGEPYSNKELKQTLKDDSYVYPFLDQADDAGSSFFADDTYDNGLNTGVNTYLDKAVDTILKNPGASTESVITTLASGVSDVLSRCCPNFK